MFRKIVIITLVTLATVMLGMVSLFSLSLNLVYVRSECPVLQHIVSYGSENRPIANILSRQFYLFRSSSDGSLAFKLTSRKTYELGYLTIGQPSYFLVHFDNRCRFYGSQHYLL